MKTGMTRFWVLAAALAGFAVNAFAGEVVKTDKFDMNVGGRLQLLGLGENVRDPYREDSRVYLFIKQARLLFDGHADDYRYHLQLAFAGEEELAASPGVALDLLDYDFDVPLTNSVYAKIGQ